MKSQTTPIRVLIAEDSPTYRELLVTILQSAPDLQVIGTARNGAEAVRLAKRLRPDVITMDVYMPEMDGFEATRQIMTEMPCPVVVISASTDKDQRDLTFNALKAGALSVLEKPTLQDTPEAYEAWLGRSGLCQRSKWCGAGANRQGRSIRNQQRRRMAHPLSRMEIPKFKWS